MEVRRRRLTLGRLMAIIGIVALGFAMSRVDATPAVSFCIFAACSWYLAGRRYTEALARRAAEGASIGPSQKARIAARCADRCGPGDRAARCRVPGRILRVHASG